MTTETAKPEEPSLAALISFLEGLPPDEEIEMRNSLSCPVARLCEALGYQNVRVVYVPTWPTGLYFLSHSSRSGYVQQVLPGDLARFVSRGDALAAIEGRRDFLPVSRLLDLAREIGEGQ